MPLKKKKKPLKKKRPTKKKILRKRPQRKCSAKKRPTKKPPVRKKVSIKKSGQKPVIKQKENIIGKITHYFPKVRAAVVKLSKPLAVGDNIKIKGHTTDFTQAVTSIQINHVPVNVAKKGDEIGILVDSRVREHDIVYKI